MVEISGVRAQSPRTLPAEEPQAPPQADTPASASAADSAAAPAAAQKAKTPAEASTPQEAVQAIHALPLPRRDDLAGMPGQVAASVYTPRVEAFNATRAEQAQAALDRFAPQRGDFAGLNGATASYEYDNALTAYKSNPYTQELQRVVDEAKAQPSQVPAYLTAGQPTTTNVSSLPLEQVSSALGALGVQLPANPSPEQVQSAYELLGKLPDEALGWAMNPGSQVNFSTPVIGAGTPQLIPARVGGDVRVNGEVKLSQVQTDVNFRQTQQFEMSAQMQVTGSASFGKTPLNRIYGWADRLGVLSPGAKSLVESSPFLRNVVKGLPIPVSASAETFSGTRLTYQATVTPQQGTQLSKGDLSAAPNPLDPMNMPLGTSVLMRGDTLSGTSFAASYKLLNGETTHTELKGQGFGVRRVDANTFEVYSGPIKTVENEMFLGIGRRGLLSAGIGVDKSMDTQAMSVARLDLRTEEGRAAYQNFMSSGQIPNWSPPGVSQSGKSEIYNSDHVASVGANVGSLSWMQEINSSHLSINRTTWQDGSIEQTNSYTINNDHSSEVSFKLGADGKPIEGATTYRVMLANYNESLTSYMQNAFDGEGAKAKSFDGNQHVQLTFNDSQLMQLRDIAQNHLDKTGRGELPEMIRAGSAASSDFDVKLAMATTPGEVFAVVSNDFTRNFMAQDLLGMAMMTGQSIPGQIAVRDAGN